MQNLTSFQSIHEAIDTLDNGGRFYNFFTDANDGEISEAELSKAAGVYSDKQKMKLYLEMALKNFSEEEKKRVLDMMPFKLQSKLEGQDVFHYSVSQAIQDGQSGQVAIVKGKPKWVENKTDFVGFIMIPISTGSVTTFTMIPIMENYDIYELYDELNEQEFLIAHAKGMGRLPERLLSCGGILKELKSDKKKKEADKHFLELVYYSEI